VLIATLNLLLHRRDIESQTHTNWNIIVAAVHATFKAHELLYYLHDK